MFPFSHEGYKPEEEGPEARMAREIQEQHEKDCKAIDCLLASLKPEDALRRLIPWRLIKKWRLPHRSRPIEPC